MIIALLSLLGVPLWLLLGWLAAGWWHRHQIKQLPDVFKLKVRVIKGTYRHIDDKFSRTALYGLWAHDILIVEKGLLVGRNLHFPAAEGVQPPQTADGDKVKRLGDNPVTMQFRLDNDAVIEVAAPGDAVQEAQGPFFAESDQDEQSTKEGEAEAAAEE